ARPRAPRGRSRPLPHNGEAFQGVNNFLLTMRTLMAGYSPPFWMTIPQARVRTHNQ
ncbi:MAG: ArdC family protein, partial [Aestuariivita sp.]|nr:ArdC family protein [Aestuariivita sp.]